MPARRTRSDRPVWWFDGALAAALVLLGAVEIAAGDPRPGWEVALVLVGVLPVAVRRVAPLPAAFAVVAVQVAGSALGGWIETFNLWLALIVVVFSVGEAGAVAGAVALLGLLWVGVAVDTDDLVPDLVFSGIVMATVWGGGCAVGAHRRRTAALRELAARLEREREVGVRLTILQERARVAGEVHDAVGHTVAGMLAQAEAAGEVIARDETRARQALGVVQESGREAIAQMRSTLQVLRSDATELEPDPIDVVPASKPLPWTRRPVLAEALLMCALVVLWTVEIVWFPYPADGSKTVSFVLAAVPVAAVAIRARAPLVAAATLAVASFATSALGGVWWDGLSIVVSVLLVMYAIGAHPVRTRAVIGGVATTVLVVGDESFGREPDPATAPYVALIVLIPWLAGWLVRRHREQAQRLAELARELEHERRANARLAVLAERTHMARELHDTVAHGVNVMIVQAAAAEHASRHDAAAARAAIDAICATGRDVIGDLQRLLGLLDVDEHAAPRAPQPTLDEIGALVAQVRDAGLPVTLRVEGTPAPVPADVAGSAFRIVQEALTNVLKHAGTPTTSVVVRYLRGALDVAVDDDGPVVQAANGGGHGLIGMRERAALAGGELQAGPRAAGGYAVHARLPLDGGRP